MLQQETEPHFRPNSRKGPSPYQTQYLPFFKHLPITLCYVIINNTYFVSVLIHKCFRSHEVRNFPIPAALKSTAIFSQASLCLWRLDFFILLPFVMDSPLPLTRSLRRDFSLSENFEDRLDPMCNTKDQRLHTEADNNVPRLVFWPSYGSSASGRQVTVAKHLCRLFVYVFQSA